MLFYRWGLISSHSERLCLFSVSCVYPVMWCKPMEKEMTHSLISGHHFWPEKHYLFVSHMYLIGNLQKKKNERWHFYKCTTVVAVVLSECLSVCLLAGVCVCVCIKEPVRLYESVNCCWSSSLTWIITWMLVTYMSTEKGQAYAHTKQMKWCACLLCEQMWICIAVEVTVVHKLCRCY